MGENDRSVSNLLPPQLTREIPGDSCAPLSGIHPENRLQDLIHQDNTLETGLPQDEAQGQAQDLQEIADREAACQAEGWQDEAASWQDESAIQQANLIARAKSFLPSWCTTLRENQISALIQIQAAIDSGKRNIIFEGPTGMGKTLTAYLVAKLNNARANYICTTKSLQAQAEKDFADSQFLMGRVNYPTADYRSQFPGTSCRDCNYKTNIGCRLCSPDCNSEGAILPWTSKLKCPYYIQKKRTQAADLSILNTAYAITVFSNYRAAGIDNVKGKLGYEQPYIDPYSDADEKEKAAKDTYGFACRGLSIYDEADELEKTIMDFIEVELNPYTCDLLKLETPLKSSRWPARIEFLQLVIKRITEYEKRVQEIKTQDLFTNTKLNAEPQEYQDPEFEDKKMKTLIELREKLEFVSSSIDPLTVDERRETWVYERIDADHCKFKPVRIDKFAREAIFRHSHINFITSATVIAPEQFAQDLGLEQNETAFISMPSPFDPIRRPFIYRGVGNMSYKTKSTAIPKIAAEIAKIRRQYQGRMLVHTVSYELNQALYSDLTRNGFDVFTYSNASNRASAIENFTRTENSILLAVSLARGVDFKHDLCRLNIIAKVPFPNLSDLQTSRRMHQPTPREGELWYKLKTIRDIIQMYGRGMRSEDDWCRTFILDEQFIRLWREVKSMLPNWFLDAVVFDSRDRLGEAYPETLKTYTPREFGMLNGMEVEF